MASNTKKRAKKLTVWHLAMNGSGMKHRGYALQCSICHHIGGKSICTCEHVGDGGDSQHAGQIGHGGCRIPDCSCIKFSWAGWSPSYALAVKTLLIRR